MQKDNQEYRQTMKQSFQQLNKENAKLVEQLRDMMSLCEDQIDNRANSNQIKHVLHVLFSVIYYMQLKATLAQQRNRNIYKPMIEGYLKQFGKKKVNKFRVCAHMIIAIQRMRSYKTSKLTYSPLSYNILRATETRKSMINLGEHLN